MWQIRIHTNVCSCLQLTQHATLGDVSYILHEMWHDLQNIKNFNILFLHFRLTNCSRLQNLFVFCLLSIQMWYWRILRFKPWNCMIFFSSRKKFFPRFNPKSAHPFKCRMNEIIQILHLTAFLWELQMRKEKKKSNSVDLIRQSWLSVLSIVQSDKPNKTVQCIDW